MRSMSGGTTIYTSFEFTNYSPEEIAANKLDEPGEFDNDILEDLEIEVEADSITPPSKGSRRGDPGDWEPDDPGEVADLHYYLDGVELTEAQFEFLGGDPKDAAERVFVAAMDSAKDADDDADYWRDSRRDDY